MPESHEAADDRNLARAERESACAGFHTECADLMHSVEAGLQKSTETSLTPETTVWAVEGFADLEPENSMLAACAAFEADERQFDPSYDISTENPADIRADIEALMAERALVVRNANTTGQISDGVPAKVPAEVGQEAEGLRDERNLAEQQVDLSVQHDGEKEKTDRAATVTESKEAKADELERLQLEFNQLGADGVSTVDALRRVIAQAKNPETQQHLNAILNRVAVLQTALPDKPEVVTRLLNTSGLNLSAATVAGSFAGFLEAADTDDALTAVDRATLRQIITRGDEYLKTGTQVHTTARKTTIDPATGREVPLHLPGNKLKVREGVYTYTETGDNVMLELNEGSLHQTVDVTSLDGASIGIVTEIYSLAALAHKRGADGFLKHLYSVDVESLAGQRFDPITLNGLQQKLTHLMNTGHDGQIFSPDQQAKLLETQMRLVSPTGELLAWEDDPEGYRDSVEELGLHHDAVLEAFGQYTRLNTSAISRDELQRHLHSRFPYIVKNSD